MQTNARKTKMLVITIFIIYLIIMFAIAMNFDTSHGSSEITDENVNNESNIRLDNTYMYILTSNKSKYDRLLPSDVSFIKVSDISLMKNNILESQDKNINLREECKNFFNSLNDIYYFTKDELIDLSSSEIYILNDKNEFNFLTKNDYGTKDDLIKNKILDYSYLGYRTFEIPYKEKISESIEIGFNDTDTYTYSEYKNIKENFKTGCDIDVMIFKQNKVDYKIEMITNLAKLIDIDDDHATVCVMQKDSDALKEILDKENVLISREDISTREEIPIE
ncbi:MAG: hypothetical protein MJ244_05345 [Clostridia bacterium]|nr:hypothetical protein [Clostridia bacterium]